MQVPLNLLVIEDSETDFLLIGRHLRTQGLAVQCRRVDTLVALQTSLDEGEWDLVLSDYNVPGLDFLEGLSRIQSQQPDLPVILVSGSVGEEQAVELLKQGVWDFVLKDRLMRLVPVIERSLGEVAEQRARRTAEDILRRSEENLKRAQAVAHTGSWHLDIVNDVLECSEETHRICDIPLEQALKFGDFLRCLYPGDRAAVQEAWTAALRGAPYDIEYRIIAEKGALPWVQVKAEVRFDPAGSPVSCVGTIQDVTGRKAADERLELAATAFENMAEAIMVTDRRRRIVSVNRAFTEITGYLAEDVLGEDLKTLRASPQDGDFSKGMWKAIRQQGAWCGEVWQRRRTGERYPAWLKINVVRDRTGNITHYVGVFSDISEQKAAQARIEHLAHHDPLTGLANRALLGDRLQQALLQAKRDGQQVAVIFVDLDGFKTINDSLGHPAGDSLLCDVAQRLKQCVRATDTVSRLSGDEFIVVLSDVKDVEGVTRVVGGLSEAMTQPFSVQGHLLRVTLSMGISLYPRDGHEVATLLTNADNALYAAKAAGRNTYRFFSAEMDAQARARFRTEMDLRSALERGEFRVYYQPQVQSRSGRMTAVEALLRWQHPQRGLLSPGSFLDVAEDTGLIVPIGEWVLHQACRQCQHWHEAGYPLSVAVNLSPRQFRLEGLLDTVKGALTATGLAADFLELELTERLLVEPTARTMATLQGLQSLGIRIAVDDFGTGYSSLTYLKRFPISTLKIAKPFVDEIAVNGDDRAIAQAVVALARAMRLETVAEGVEQASQERVLREIGCGAIQGFYFSRPVPAPELFGLDGKGTGPLLFTGSRQV